MAGEPELVQCPMCEGVGQIGIFPYQYTSRSNKIRVYHNSPPSYVMRCPLCYKKGRITKELYSAFFLNYGDTLDMVWYKAVNVFRCEFNSVCANEIREITGG